MQITVTICDVCAEGGEYPTSCEELALLLYSDSVSVAIRDDLVLVSDGWEITLPRHVCPACKDTQPHPSMRRLRAAKAGR